MNNIMIDRFLSDEKYEAGTVIAIGGEKEITSADGNTMHSVIGVVTVKRDITITMPIYVDVALKGRCSVKVIGWVKKGDRLTASGKKGYAKVDNNSEYSFAISLETGSDMIEAVIL